MSSGAFMFRAKQSFVIVQLILGPEDDRTMILRSIKNTCIGQNVSPQKN
jgi:hypothetical protein